MSSHTYTIKYQTCATDSFSNTCATNCCATTSGGILSSVQSCTTDANLCGNGSQTTIQTQLCGMDLADNWCIEECCAKYTTGNQSYMTCEPQMFCKGLNPRALTQANYQTHEAKIQAALVQMPTVNTDGKIALAVLGGVTGLLIIILVLLCFLYIKEKNKLKDFIHGQRKNATSSEKTQLIEENGERK